MLSVRAFARAAPRAAARIAPAARGLRSASSGLVQKSLTAAFSTSTARCAPPPPEAAEVDEELSAKLASEIQFETEIRENEPQATSVRDFLESGLFEIEDVPGREEVVLRRTYGKEKITVTFSVADLANYDPELYDEDAALGDEEGGGSSSGKKQAEAENEGEELEEDDEHEAASVPCRLSIVVEKPGVADAGGALNIEATAQDGALVVDNLHYYADAAHAHAATAAAAHDAERVYPGPAFGSLDEDLQVLLDRYLEERGITQALAVFVPEYLDAKEQREYLGFLQNLKGFVDA
ncbi:regulatory protein suaprga1 [Niveomyces insectorum RCEF 264]|uniref:Regulatory protein suaprga1 n=1 Tax=Niveomyces insectorum RCEF 264 TaxID=1081102 RepID=A0A167SQU6_9HYPO|nr:regulatory protein suaprga1 [Niveomyces insectorum RCEF 264]